MDPKVLKSYYYGITHLQVGGRCKCNGHSNVCIPKDPADPTSRSICLCKHGTTGDNCETCLRDHWDRRWQRATSQNANPCLRKITKLSVPPHDSLLTLQPVSVTTGPLSVVLTRSSTWPPGGAGSARTAVATGMDLTARSARSTITSPQSRTHWDVSPASLATVTPQVAVNTRPHLTLTSRISGSTDLQCSNDGKCKCKPGVTGDKCDKCEANYWNFPDSASRGCESCDCMVEGSLGNRPSCNTETGDCDCKQNVEGQRCDRCKSGHFYIDLDNDFGCTPCFCYGHTAQCSMAQGYTQTKITSDFSRGPDHWQTEENGQAGLSEAEFDSFKKFITLQSVAHDSYFVAPQRFIGDQRWSYNRELKFSLKIGAEDIGPRPTAEDIIIEGGGDKPTRLSLTITAQNNPIPTADMQEYSFLLHENPEYGWTPSLRPKDFIAVLSNITSIKIRGSYVHGGFGGIDEFIMESATEGGSGKPATWVEQCECPQGYSGQFCQKCQLGFYHENKGGPFARCIPCNCNGHSDYCDDESGVCDCSHNTGGDNCEICADGFYGDAILGTPDDCAVCPCPAVEGEDGNMRAGKCYELEGHPESPICAECPTGRIGSRCELCEDGYFGDPEGLQGPRRECRKCECSRNIDPSAIGNCDRVTGECLRCIDDTAGFNCEKCKSGFFGDALAPRQIGDPKNCQPCQCYPVGTFMSELNELPECNAFTGKCSCKENVIGHDCDKCKDGYWNIMSQEGCEACNCDPIGALNATCDLQTGQCFCRDGLEGLRCDRLKPLHYRPPGQQEAQPCDCDPTGSLSDQCDVLTGQCPCRDKVEGRKCDTCMENTKTKSNEANQKVCEPCDDCYNLVQDAANSHRENLNQLETLLTHISENPEPVGDEFEVKLKKLKVTIRNTLFDAKFYLPGAGGSLRDRLEDLNDRLTEVVEVVGAANTQLDMAQTQGEAASQNVGRAEQVINRARESLRNAKNLLDVEGKEALRKAQDKARDFGVGNAQMSSLASSARKLAEEQFESASEIESIANQANEISTEAYSKARGALNEQVDTANQIELLQSYLRQMGGDLAQVSAEAEETLKQADEQYLKALTIYQGVFNLKVPTVETSEFSEEAGKVSKDAERIKDEARRLMEENEEMFRSTMSQRFELEGVVKTVMQQQQQLQSKLTDMENNKEAANNAVETGNEVLEKARKTLEILQDFENRVNENRAAAEVALDKIANIENTLSLASQDTASADEALHHTDTDSVRAYEIAVESKKTAEEASKNAKTINDESTTVLEKAEKLNTDAESLKDKSDETMSRMERKKSASSRDAQTAADALKEANKAQSSSLEATEKVKQAKRELEEISQILASIDIQGWTVQQF